ncbi:MAG: peptide/nickel transport system permease protein [Thermomicrobiales bacterium]|jgi:peptide/nickel transport system permease protein|nr:peptide/nickel transport system permease protein [Thermomicrobiales bacterium]MEA2527044.1 peptide/nickel transport system permease protein [Thermomicrobiales bacterium]MEA2596685.1 peptide/nickel transport system permease protein [Thermomicrobiales bacterium]
MEAQALSGPRVDLTEAASRAHRTWFQETLTRLLQNKGASAGLVVLLVIAVVVILAPAIAPYDPIKVDTKNTDSPPTWSHPFGTDTIGRDILSRIMQGGRLTVIVGIVAIAIAAGAGLPLGMLAGYYGGWTDRVISRFMDIMLAFPGILLALGVVAVLGSSVFNVTIAVGISLIPGFVRLVRGSYLSSRDQTYVEAARVIGTSNGRIIVRHILPNVLAPVMVLATVAMGWAIIIGAALSFLGLGAQAPTPEWGTDLASGREWIRTAWWMSTFPGLAITIVVIAVNLVGDGLRDALDPRLRTR